MKRFWIALIFVLKHWLRPMTAWKVAGLCLEMGKFCREHGIHRDGVWLVGMYEFPGIAMDRGLTQAEGLQEIRTVPLPDIEDETDD